MTPDLNLGYHADGHQPDLPVLNQNVSFENWLLVDVPVALHPLIGKARKNVKRYETTELTFEIRLTYWNAPVGKEGHEN